MPPEDTNVRSGSAPIWAREQGRRRSTLSQDTILEAAIKIADTDGLDAVSIRRVATELGVRAMSLYTYIERKDDLFDLMADKVVEGILIEGELPADWRAAISMIARREREIVLDRPWIMDLMSQRTRYGPTTLKHLEQSLAAVSGLTQDPQAMVDVVAAVDHYVLGYVVREARLLGMERRGDPVRAGHFLRHPFFRSLIESGDFPFLEPVVRAGVYDSQGFDQGLDWLLDGIERAHRPG